MTAFDKVLEEEELSESEAEVEHETEDINENGHIELKNGEEEEDSVLF